MPGMQDQMLQMAVIFGTMHIVKKAGLEDPEYMPLIRGVYGVATALMIALVFYLKSTITAKNDTTALEYDDPAPGSQGGRVVTTNVKHDISEIGKLQKSTLLTVGIVIFMHFKFGYIQPLILQTLLPMLNMYKSPLFQIHILGRPATDDLKRPWTPANPFAGFGGGSNANATSEGNDDAQASASSGNDSASDAESTSGKKEKKENEKSEKKGKKGKKETRKDK